MLGHASTNQASCSQWVDKMVQFTDEDSNIIGYSGLSDTMADSVKLCAFLIYIC